MKSFSQLNEPIVILHLAATYPTPIFVTDICPSIICYRLPEYSPTICTSLLHAPIFVLNCVPSIPLINIVSSISSLLFSGLRIADATENSNSHANANEDGQPCNQPLRRETCDNNDQVDVQYCRQCCNEDGKPFGRCNNENQCICYLVDPSPTPVESGDEEGGFQDRDGRTDSGFWEGDNDQFLRGNRVDSGFWGTELLNRK